MVPPTPPQSDTSRSLAAVILSSDFCPNVPALHIVGDTRGNLPFDGLLTQHADLFLRVVNKRTGVPPDPESTHQHDEY